MVQYLLESGASPNAISKTDFGGTPVIYATKHRYSKILKILIEYGANIYQKDKDGKTALQYAIEYKYIDEINLLGKHDNRKK